MDLTSLFRKEKIPDVYLYNTLDRKKELFTPIKAGRVLFYQCGPTVYSVQHLGNIRAAVLSDFIRRTLNYCGYKVDFVRNYTDVGHLTGDNLGDADLGVDRMEKAARQEHLSPEKITQKYILIFERDAKELNILEPNEKPRATQYIPEMIAFVQVLLEKGFAYSTDLAIYFDVSKAKNYTQLSGQNLKENISGAGTGDVEDPQKKNPADFSLWFFRAGKHAHALQFWQSPFPSKLVQNGEGFPGWHIECSAMIKKLLGDTIDIHMGGVEHISIHHTNEIAQSEAANGVPLSHFWLHNEWLTMSNEKISKSEGTAITLADIIAKGYSPIALRFFFMQANYRSRQNFTWEALDAAANGYKNLLLHIVALGNTVGKVNKIFKDEFKAKIADDFNIPSALAFVFEVLKSDISNPDKLATILDFDAVLGLKLRNTSSQKMEIEKIALNGSYIIFDGSKPSDEITELIKQRSEARTAKNWQKADELRDKLMKLGVESNDSANESNYRKIN